MIEFLKNYWMYIVSALIFVAEIIILIVKKRPKTLNDFISCAREVCCDLPNLINSVEVAGHGLEKKSKVICLALDESARKLGRALDDEEVLQLSSIFSKQIEKVLSTPQKKEVN